MEKSCCMVTSEPGFTLLEAFFFFFFVWKIFVLIFCIGLGGWLLREKAEGKKDVEKGRGRKKMK